MRDRLHHFILHVGPAPEHLREHVGARVRERLAGNGY
jgi:hypothetical protein